MSETPVPPPKDAHKPPPADRTGLHRTFDRAKRRLLRADPVPKDSKWMDENGRPVEIGEKSQYDIIKEVVFDRYEKMHRRHKQTGGKLEIQEFDVMADNLMKQIAKENGIDLQHLMDKSPPAVEDDYIQEIEKQLGDMRLDRLDQQTRNSVYTLLLATEMEIAGSLAADFAKRETPALPGKLAAAINTNSFLLNLNYAISTRVSGGDADARKMDKSKWMQLKRGRKVMSVEPAEVSYRSAYTDVLFGDGSRPADPAIKEQMLQRMEEYRKTFAKADAKSFGAEGKNIVEMMSDFFTKDADALLVKDPNDTWVNQAIAGSMAETLKGDYGVQSFKDLQPEDVLPAMLQGIRRTYAEVGAERAVDFMNLQVEATIYGHEGIERAREKVEGIKPENPELQGKDKKEVERLKKEDEQIKGLDASVVKVKEKKKIHEGGDFAKQEQLCALERDRADEQEKSHRAAAKGLKGSNMKAENDVADEWARRRDEWETKRKAADENIKSAKDAYTTEVASLKAVLTTYGATIAEINKIITSTGDFVSNEYDIFIQGRKTKYDADRKKSDEKTEKQKEELRKKKEVSEKVLEAIEERTDPENRANLIAQFTRNTITEESYSKPEEFVKLLGLEADPKVMPPRRLARLLAAHLEMEDINLSEIPARGEAFDAVWNRIMEKFIGCDGYRKGKAVMEIYNDRVKALAEADVFDDVLKEEHVHARKRYEISLSQTKTPGELVRVMESQGKIAGIDVVVDEAAGFGVVAENGKVAILKREQAGGNTGTKYEYAKAADLSVEKDATGKYAVAVQGKDTEMAAREAVLGEFSRRAIMQELKGVSLMVPTSITDAAGVTRIFQKKSVGVPPVETIEVVAAPELSGSPMELSFFMDQPGTFGFKLQSGGKYAEENPIAKSRNLHKLRKEKRTDREETGFTEEPTSVSQIGREMLWVNEESSTSNPNGDAIELRFEEGKAVVENMTYDTSAKKWVHVVIGGSRAPMDFDDFMKMNDTADPEGLRIRLASGAFDLFMNLSDEERRGLDFGSVNVDVRVQSMPSVFPGKATVQLKETGELALIDSLGGSWRLGDVINYAVKDNDGTGVFPEYDIIPTPLSGQPNLKLQADIGAEFIRAVQRQKAKK